MDSPVFQELLKIGRIMGSQFAAVWPYLLLTIPFSIFIRVKGFSPKVSAVIGKRPLAAIVIAALIGSFSPLCSCSVIPLVIALLTAGVPAAPVMAFWIASPSVDIEILFLTAGQLGWELALVRLGAALLLSISAGLFTRFLILKNYMSPQILRSVHLQIDQEKKEFCCCSGSSNKEGCGCAENSGNECCKTDTIQTSGSCGCSSAAFENKSSRTIQLPVWLRKSIRPVLQVSAFLVLAFLIQALIILYVSQNWIINILGKQNPFSVLWSSLAGIPLYTNNITAVGVVEGLMQKGMNHGAVLSFFISGPVTTLPAMSAVYTICKPKVFLLYLGIAFFGSLSAGYLYYIIKML